jgi:YidC/Oxa1 family membrane protein insertase
MDNLRLILIFALAFVLLLLYQAWMKDYGAPPGPQPAQTSSVEAPPADPGGEAVPSAPAVTPETPPLPSDQPASGAADTTPAVVRVRTDVLDLEISTRGGDLKSLLLRDYPVSPDAPDTKFQLLKPSPPNLFVAQSGLLGSDPATAPTHEARFRADRAEYTLEEGERQLTVTLHWSHPSGVEVAKHYLFRRGSYLIEVRHEVTNRSGKPWSGRTYSQLQRTPPPEDSGSTFIYTFTGAAIYSPEEKYEKLSFDDMQDAKLDQDVKGGWISMIQHYFLAAWIPPAETVQHFYTNVLSGGRYVVGMYSPPLTIADGESHSFDERIFAGPKLQDDLAQVAPGLELTVDYGWLTVLSQPLFWLLEKLHDLLGNWGWAIIFLTILIKLAFYKLSEASYKSMANMRRMAPRLQALKDRYGSDKQRLNQAMMDLYKKEKINPLGGCLPVLVQIPVFIALYWVLLESVELRQAPFILWMDNLSAPDPYFILPLLMGISMFIQQKLNPAPVDPMQAKIMMTLPIVFTVFFAFFPAGLVLYWVVNNILSIAQQWYITHKIEQAAST